MPPTVPPKILWFATVLVLLGSAVAWGCWLALPPDHLQPGGISFEDGSDQLRQTVIVQTLAAPVPERKSAIWCSLPQLSLGIPFRHRFTNLGGGLEFTDTAGQKTKVRAFGIAADQRHSGLHTYRAQVDILHYQAAAGAVDREEFILDLNIHSQPNQLVVARVAWQGTLQKTLAEAQTKLAIGKHTKFGEADELAVPLMHWRIVHFFPDPSGKEKPQVEQSLHFQLDRGIVHQPTTRLLTVEQAKQVGRKFHFKEPYLVFVKGRDVEQPFFVMWVDNAELLSKK